MKRTLAALLAAAAPPSSLAACSLDSAVAVGDDAVNVVVGYQSKTINTVTAGTLLRAKGFLEQRLADITKRTGTSTTCSGRTTTPAHRSPRRWSPRRSTSARWATTRC